MKACFEGLCVFLEGGDAGVEAVVGLERGAGERLKGYKGLRTWASVA